ncbi:MAG: 4Fe-4S dicluster domain-containing protein [bacterium]|jgi:DMSO reductase family type II enzyme iron-sulfur subunit
MSKHQYAMVMDLNKCIGCHTCSVACKKQWTDQDGKGYMYWNNVETHPGEGYPRSWHRIGGGFDPRRNLKPSVLPGMEDYGEAFEYDYNQRLFEGKNKPVMPHKLPTYGPNWDEDVGGSDTRNPYFFYLPRICNHCTHPACVEACTRKAIYKREEDGIVLIDQERCKGYRDCIRACPYKKIYFNEVTGKSEKCIFCYPRLEKGQVNACAAQCPGRIRFVGILDDPESPVHKLVMKYQVALGLFPEKGTHPNVYYVPPFNPPKEGFAGRSILDDPRLPLEYLIYLFGKEVVRVIQFLEQELRQAQEGKPSEVLQLLIGRDNGVRFRVSPEVIHAGAPAEVQQQTRQQETGPALTIMGTPGEATSQTALNSEQLKSASVTMLSAAGMNPVEAELERKASCDDHSCHGCHLSPHCSLG